MSTIRRCGLLSAKVRHYELLAIGQPDSAHVILEVTGRFTGSS